MSREMTEEQRERLRAYGREYYRQHAEERKAYNKAYSKTHKEKRAEQQRKYKNKNPQRCVLYQMKSMIRNALKYPENEEKVLAFLRETEAMIIEKRNSQE